LDYLRLRRLHFGYTKSAVTPKAIPLRAYLLIPEKFYECDNFLEVTYSTYYLERNFQIQSEKTVEELKEKLDLATVSSLSTGINKL